MLSTQLRWWEHNPVLRVWLPIVGGVLVGAAVPVLGMNLIYLATLALVLVLILNTADIGALFVGGYWIAFAVKSTIFSEVIIEGLFYPFYLAFVIVILRTLMGRGLTVVPVIFWLIFSFFGVVFVSLIGYDNPVDGSFVQEFVAMLICPLVLFAIQTRSGLRQIATLAALAGTAVSVWVITESASGGFTYRGDVDVNQNIAAFVVGVSLTIVMGSFLQPVVKARPLLRIVQFLGAGLMAYALLLLASRGMTIAFVVAAGIMFVIAIRRDRRVLRTAFLLLAIMALGLLLPGGDGLLDRFEGESVSSAGDRTPIWVATIDAIIEGDFLALTLGHGFNSSQQVVRDATATHTSTHNAYLSMGYEYGFLGLFLFLALHSVVLVRAGSLHDERRLWAVGIIWFLLAANLTTTTPDDFMYWLALGFAMACVSVGGQFSLGVDRPTAVYTQTVNAVTSDD